MLKKLVHFFILLAILASASLLIRHFSVKHIESDANFPAQALFTTSLLNLQGKPHMLNDYAGKVLVVNFWATWCPPCREEMPELSALQQAYAENNLVVLGIAIDDIHSVNAFLQKSPVRYPIFIADENSHDLNAQLGNNQGVLPYTVIINRDGIVQKTFFGRINKTLLETAILPLLPNSS